VIAKPQLRGAEGTKLTLKLGDKVRESRQLHAHRDGGAGVNPLSSYSIGVGVSVEMTGR